MQRRYAQMALLGLAALTISACDFRTMRGDPGADVDIGGSEGVHIHARHANFCAGRVALSQGQATVRDDCFSGDTDVVICSDASTASPLRCSPGLGTLTIAGNGSDIVSYARIR